MALALKYVVKPSLLLSHSHTCPQDCVFVFCLERVGLEQEEGQDNDRSPQRLIESMRGPRACADFWRITSVNISGRYVFMKAQCGNTDKWDSMNWRKYLVCDRNALIGGNSKFLERRKRTDAELRKELRGEKREKARIKETNNPTAIDNTYGTPVRGRHNYCGRGRFQLMIPPIASCSCLWAGSYKVPTVAASCFSKA